MAKALHTWTAAEVTQNFAIVHITWPIPWPDLNFAQTFGIRDTDVDVELDNFVLDMHNVTPAGFDAIVGLAVAIPLLQGDADVVNVNTPSSATFTALEDTIYTVTLYALWSHSLREHRGRRTGRDRSSVHHRSRWKFSQFSRSVQKRSASCDCDLWTEPVRSHSSRAARCEWEFVTIIRGKHEYNSSRKISNLHSG